MIAGKVVDIRNGFVTVEQDGGEKLKVQVGRTDPPVKVLRRTGKPRPNDFSEKSVKGKALSIEDIKVGASVELLGVPTGTLHAVVVA